MKSIIIIIIFVVTTTVTHVEILSSGCKHAFLTEVESPPNIKMESKV